MEPEEQSMNAMPSMVGGPSAAGRIGEGEGAGGDVDEEDPMAAYIRSERVSLHLRSALSLVRFAGWWMSRSSALLSALLLPR